MADPGATTLPDPKLKIDRFADGPVTCLRFTGVVDEQFDGKGLGGTLDGGTLVVDMGTVIKISSFGIREWIDFMRGAGEKVDTILLIELAPKVVDQLNMVMNFAGKGKVYSFYAPYRCDYCDSDRRVLLQLDRDYEAVKAFKPPERPCQACGNREYLDEDAASFLSYLAQQPRVELDPTVAAFLANRLNYAISDATRRFRVEKYIEGRSTYLRLSGDLDATFPREKIGEGLEGTVVLDVGGLGKIEPAGAAEWKTFLAQATPACERIFLFNCPPVFIERLARAQDLGGKAQVVSFSMPYACARCSTTASHVIDVAEHIDVLKFATPPQQKCTFCGGETACAAAETLLSHLPALPKPEADPPLRKFVAEARQRTSGKVMAAPAAAISPAERRSIFLPVVVAAAAAALLAAGAVLLLGGRGHDTLSVQTRSRDAVGPLVRRSADVRPSWLAELTPDVRSFAVCADEAGGLSCVGVSSTADSLEEARAEAADAALEEMTGRLALELAHDVAFRDVVLGRYSRDRQAALAAFAAARGDPDGDRYQQARGQVRERRRAVSAALKKTGGAAVPATPAAEYWEQYRAPGGDGSRYVAFAQLRVAAAQQKSLRERYAAPAEVMGARALTVYPGLAWRYPTVAAGAILAAVEPGVLRDVGLSTGDVVLEVAGRPVDDAAGFAAQVTEEALRLKGTGGALKLRVKSGDGEPRDFSLNVARGTVAAPPPPSPPGPPGPPALPPPTQGNGVNIWDRTGGGNVRDNPNE